MATATDAFNQSNDPSPGKLSIGALASYCMDVARRAKVASRELAQLRGAVKNEWLGRSAQLLREGLEDLQAANNRDLEAAPDRRSWR